MPSPAQGSRLQAIVRRAAAASVPMGIVLGMDRFLCGPSSIVPNETDGVNGAAAIRTLAEADQLAIKGTDMLVVSSTRQGSGRLGEALDHTYDTFPSLSGTMSYMGAVLDGWLSTYVHPTQGWGMSWGASPTAEQLVSPALTNTSLRQVANRVVTLGYKGIWIAEEHVSANGERTVSLRIFSYNDDAEALEHVSCRFED